MDPEAATARPETHPPNPDWLPIAVVSALPLEEWHVLRRAHPSVLLAGDDVAVNAALDAIRSSLRQPVMTWRDGDPLVLPPLPSSGTLILRGVDALSQEDQQCLLSWLQEALGTMQVVSTTRGPLFRLVERSVFLDTLYYRLNVVYLEMAL